jgi:hypothetical protein
VVLRYFLVWRLLPVYCRCIRLLLQLITFSDIYTLGMTPLDERSARRRGLNLCNVQHSQQTNIHAPGRIQTHDPIKRAALDPRLRPRGHRDRPNWPLYRERKNFKVRGNWMSVIWPACLLLLSALQFVHLQADLSKAPAVTCRRALALSPHSSSPSYEWLQHALHKSMWMKKKFCLH